MIVIDTLTWIRSTPRLLGLAKESRPAQSSQLGAARPWPRRRRPRLDEAEVGEVAEVLEDRERWHIALLRLEPVPAVSVLVRGGAFRETDSELSAWVPLIVGPS